VLRKKQGDEIEVVDGKGNYFRASVTDANFKKTEATIIEKTERWHVQPYSVSIAISLSKNPDRFEWFCEKATEIGVNEIIPLIAERTESRKLKVERIHKILISAMKQSGKALLPELKKETQLSDFLKSMQQYNQHEKFIGWCEIGEEQLLKNLYQKGSNALILIGPEGDFTKDEVDVAIQNEFVPVSLGKSRLRLETAGIVACQIVNLLNE